MPAQASIAKVESTRSYGATVTLEGDHVSESLEAATQRAAEAGMTFVHPFDDPDIVAGQGTLGLELLDDVPDLAKVIVPVGGGGLISGIAIAVKDARPDVEVVGVRSEVRSSQSIADGIAVKDPGVLNAALIDAWVDAIVTVSEDEIADAMVLALETAKLVVEGAGAVGIAALLSGAAAPAARGRRSSCCRAATSTRACWQPSRAATRRAPAGAWCCARASPTARARSPRC